MLLSKSDALPRTTVRKQKKAYPGEGYIGVLDLGTTSVRFIIFKLDSTVQAQAFQPIAQTYPQSGWVEEDLNEIWSAACMVIEGAIDQGNIKADSILALGITNQRESVGFWDKDSGKPLAPLIVWQDRRTSRLCKQLKDKGYEQAVREKTGLTIDPYFSGTKINWMLKNNDAVRDAASRGRAVFGTLDSFIIYRLTGSHITDYSNASRTLLFNISSLKWDDELLDIFGVPKNILPEARPSYGHNYFGKTDRLSPFKASIPIQCVFGDQQAALFGQKCFYRGDVKSTFGTGSFIMMNSGKEKVNSKHGLLSTIFYSNGRELFYALEGSVYNTGSVFQWLKEGIEIIGDYKDIEFLASGQDYQKDLFLVPALTGMGAPYWDPLARGLLIGITRSTSKKQIVRAAVESIAYRTLDVLNVLERETNLYISSIKIDGGVTRNRLFCQVLADITGKEINKLDLPEITALGSMYGAGLSIGLWSSQKDIKQSMGYQKYVSQMEVELRNNLYSNWQRAVDRAKNWAQE
ncbi:MAG: glycerol kinase GlpK [Actinomycetia bacterium]|nr:glycerol kinase GlpK [Actinomycetes bacterium]